MSGKVSTSDPLTGLVLGGVFLVLLAFFLDAVWVVGAQAWVHAFGQRTQGQLVGEQSYWRTGKNGRRYQVTVHTYAFQDASGVTHEHQTGQKPFLFNKALRGSYRAYDPGLKALPVTVLYLPGKHPFSWAVEYEDSWGANLVLPAVLLLPLLAVGVGAYAMLMKGEPGPNAPRPSHGPKASPAPSSPQAEQPSRSQKRRQRKKRR
jgi:hypothetical protein